MNSWSATASCSRTMAGRSLEKFCDGRRDGVHTLSGIGTINDKKVATIDNADYSVGDTVPTMGMEIIAIGTGRVEFVKQASTGEECHILKFRQKKTDTNQRGLR